MKTREEFIQELDDIIYGYDCDPKSEKIARDVYEHFINNVSNLIDIRDILANQTK